MRTRTTAPWLVAAMLLVGCGSNHHSPSAQQLLSGAHASLESGDHHGAQRWLDSAGAELSSARDRREYALLTCELQVRTGQADRATATADDLLAMHPNDPRVQEMAGKAALATADFKGAVWHFDRAMNSYYADHDVRRSADLLALARGFDAYSNGRIAAAEEHWEGVQDAGLRASVLHASDAVMPGADGDGALASNLHPIR